MTCSFLKGYFNHGSLINQHVLPLVYSVSGNILSVYAQAKSELDGMYHVLCFFLQGSVYNTPMGGWSDPMILSAVFTLWRAFFSAWDSDVIGENALDKSSVDLGEGAKSGLP